MSSEKLALPTIATGVRFWAHVDIAGEDECWLWNGPKRRDGYGRFSYNGKQIQAHRMACWLTTKVYPGKLLVCHKCDNPPCCNPNHLFVGSTRDNVLDAMRKGRWYKDECNCKARLRIRQNEKFARVTLLEADASKLLGYDITGYDN